MEQNGCTTWSRADFIQLFMSCAANDITVTLKRVPDIYNAEQSALLARFALTATGISAVRCARQQDLGSAAGSLEFQL